jgi:hypothetical protein
MFIFSNRMFNRTENATANKKLLVYLNSERRFGEQGEQSG